jgi:hypothetical protein
MVKLQAFQRLELVEATQPTTRPRVMLEPLVVQLEMGMRVAMVAVLELQDAFSRLTFVAQVVVVVQTELEIF